jgi:hypothetical protein
MVVSATFYIELITNASATLEISNLSLTDSKWSS